MHDTLGQIPGDCISPQLHQYRCIVGTSSYEPADAAFGDVWNTTYTRVHTHSCGKTKSHRVEMYILNSHALIFSKFHQLFFKWINVIKTKADTKLLRKSKPWSWGYTTIWLSIQVLFHFPFCEKLKSWKSSWPGSHLWNYNWITILVPDLCNTQNDHENLFFMANQGSLLLKRWCEIVFPVWLL